MPSPWPHRATALPPTSLIQTSHGDAPQGSSAILRSQPCEAWTDSRGEEFTSTASQLKPLLSEVATKTEIPALRRVLRPQPGPIRSRLRYLHQIHGRRRRRTLASARDFHNTAGIPNGQPRARRARDLDKPVLPAVCFGTCNNAYIEAQSAQRTRAAQSRVGLHVLLPWVCHLRRHERGADDRHAQLHHELGIPVREVLAVIASL